MPSSSVPSTTNTMPAEKKTTKKSVAETPAPVPATAPAKKAPAPKKEKAPKTQIEVPTTAPAPAPAPAVAPSTPTQSSDAILSGLAATLKALGAETSAKIREAVKSAQDAAKQAKKEQRDSKKKKRKSVEEMTPEEKKAYEARRAKNAFLVPRQLSDELRAFMGLSAGEKRSQTEVTRFISEYVKTHNCFDPTFKRRILPNAALAKLLKVSDKDEVTYLNLQTYLKAHFIKNASA